VEQKGSAGIRDSEILNPDARCRPRGGGLQPSSGAARQRLDGRTKAPQADVSIPRRKSPRRIAVGTTARPGRVSIP